MDFRALAQINETQRLELLAEYRAEGVCIPCPDGVIILPGVRIAAGSILLPGTILMEGCEIGENCVLGPQTVLCRCTVAADCELNNVQGEDAVIGQDCIIGPYVRLRPGTKLGRGLRIGNFVELKNAEIGDGTKISHLSYIGDARFGQNVNVGCGLAVANYDGKNKHHTEVGDDVFLGCHNVLVSPAIVGSGAYTAAGSVITDAVPAQGFAIARARQVNKPGRNH